LEKEEWWQLVAICDQLPANIKHSSALPFAFTEEGVSMLSGVLRSSVAIQVNIHIMRAFVTVRKMLTLSPVATLADLEKLKSYMESVIADQNDINEDTRVQLELISQSLAELQQPIALPRRHIGYV
jgi:hypothetical protein